MTTRIGLWGVFDAGTLDGAATHAVVEAELQRRLPTATITAYSPLGHRRPSAVDGGRGSLPLGGGDEELPRRLAGELDCAIVCGDGTLTTPGWLSDRYGGGADGAFAAPAALLLSGGLGADLETGCPIAWSGVGAPVDLDAATTAAIRAAAGRRPVRTVLDDGVTGPRLERCGLPGMDRLPHPGMLLPRVLGTDLLLRRRKFMELAEWVPRDAGWLVVEGNAAVLSGLAELADALLARCDRTGERVVAVSGGVEGEPVFAAALRDRLGDRCHILPESITCHDLAAAITHSAGFAGNSPLCAALATAVGVPAVVISADGGEGPAAAIAQLDAGPGEPGPVVAAIARLDGHLDAVAAFAVSATRPPSPDSVHLPDPDLRLRLESLEVAAEVRRRRLIDERVVYQAELARIETLTGEQVAAAVRDQRRVRAEAARTVELVRLEMARDGENHRAEVARQQAEAARVIGKLEAELAATRDDVRRMVTSRTWRYTQWARDAYRYARPRLRGR